MHKFTRAAGAFVAAVALSVVAAPANASTDSALAGAASIATSKSVVSQLPVETEMNARFKPWKCDSRRYFRHHKRQCIRFFRHYRDDRHDRRHDRPDGWSNDWNNDNGRHGDDDRHGRDHGDDIRSR